LRRHLGGHTVKRELRLGVRSVALCRYRWKSIGVRWGRRPTFVYYQRRPSAMLKRFRNKRPMWPSADIRTSAFGPRWNGFESRTWPNADVLRQQMNIETFKTRIDDVASNLLKAQPPRRRRRRRWRRRSCSRRAPAARWQPSRGWRAVAAQIELESKT